MKRQLKSLIFALLLCLFFFSAYSSLNRYVYISTVNAQTQSAKASSVVGSVGQPQNCTLIPTSENGYDWKTANASYTLYLKTHSNWGDGMKYVYVLPKRTPYTVIYQAQDYSFRDKYGSQDYISSIADVSGVVVNNTITYSNVYSGVTLKYSALPDMVKEEYIIYNLPKTPADYLTSPVTLDFGGYIKFPSLKMFVDGQEVAQGTDFNTNSSIKFGTSPVDIYFWLPEPYAIDAKGNKTNIQYEVKKQGNQIWFYLRVPYEWLSAPERVYPVTVDPSIVGTSTTTTAISYPCQRKTYITRGGHVVYFCDGTYFSHSSSSDGVSWSGPYSGAPCYNGYEFSLWYDYTKNIQVLAQWLEGIAGADIIYYRADDTSGDLAVLGETGVEYRCPFISVDSNGCPWIIYTRYYNGYSNVTVTKSSYAIDIAGWTTATNFPQQLAGPYVGLAAGNIIPLTEGKMLALYRQGSSMRARLWNGTAFEPEISPGVSASGLYFFSAVAQGDDVHIVYLSSIWSINYIKFVYATKSFTTPITIQTVEAASAPVLSIDKSTNDLYVFWAGYPIANHIYYKKYTSSTGTWGDAVDWIDESATGLTYNYTLTCSYSSYGSKIGLVYMTGTASPYNVCYAFLSFNNAPTIGEFQAPTTVYANKYFLLNATINDADGITQFVNATVEINGTIILKWDNATNTFSKYSDTNNYCTLDASGSVRTTKNTTAYILSWKIKLSWNYTEGSIFVISTNTKCFDNAGASGSGTQTSLFTFEDDLIVYSASVNDNRINPSQSIIFSGTLYYQGTTIPPEDTSGITVKIDLGTTNKGSTTTINSDGSFSISLTGEATVGSYSYTIYSVTDENSVQNQTVNVIADRVQFTLSVTDNRINVNEEVSINVQAIYEYDSTTFQGTYTLNDTELIKSTIGKYGFKISSMSETQYGLTVFTTNEVYCIWDRDEMSSFSFSGGTLFNLTVKISSQYDGVLNSKNVKVNIYLNNSLYDTVNTVTNSSGYANIQLSKNLYGLGDLSFDCVDLDDNIYSLDKSNYVFTYQVSVGFLNDKVEIDKTSYNRGETLTMTAYIISQAKINDTVNIWNLKLYNVYWKIIVKRGDNSTYGILSDVTNKFNMSYANEYEMKTKTLTITFPEGSYYLTAELWISGSDYLVNSADSILFTVHVPAIPESGGPAGGSHIKNSFVVYIKVVDSKNDAVANANVTIIDTIYNGTVSNAVTDNSGTATFTLLEGDYYVIVDYQQEHKETFISVKEPSTFTVSLKYMYIAPITIEMNTQGILLMLPAVLGLIISIAMEQKKKRYLSIPLAFISIAFLIYGGFVFFNILPFSLPMQISTLNLTDFFTNLNLTNISLDSLIELLLTNKVVLLLSVGIFIIILVSVFAKVNTSKKTYHKVRRTRY